MKLGVFLHNEIRYTYTSTHQQDVSLNDNEFDQFYNSANTLD